MRKLNVLIIFLIIFFSLSTRNTFAQESNQITFSGTVGGSEIHMQLYPNNIGKYIGTYYYDAYQKDIMIDGYIINNETVWLSEYDEYGKIRATFSGVFIAPGTIEGVWIDKNIKFPEKATPLQFHLTNNAAKELPQAPINHNWEGFWSRKGSSFANANINISHNTGNSFWFEMEAASGANSGKVAGVALIQDNTAIFKDKNGGIMNFKLENDNLTIEQNFKMTYYGGNGVVFSGNYSKGSAPKQETTFNNLKILTPVQDEIFKNLVKEHYSTFTNTAHLTYTTEDLDGFGSRVHTMGVRGLFTIMESIIMVRDDNKIWAAVIDGNNVLYFTNTNRTKALPLTIEKWRERFKNKSVLYLSD